jgi:hypothetical protein
VSLLSNYSDKQLMAIYRVFEVAQKHLDTGGGGTCAMLLLGLYNGRRFPFDLTNLRRLDGLTLEYAMTVLHMDAYRCFAEVHVVLDEVRLNMHKHLPVNTQTELEVWAYELRLKNRCTKAEVEDLRERQRRARIRQLEAPKLPAEASHAF